jgi:hypothetical protein
LIIAHSKYLVIPNKSVEIEISDNTEEQVIGKEFECGIPSFV